jgi:hypothetical protein
MAERPQFFGAAISLEFAFLAYYVGFEVALGGAIAGSQVLEHWRQACRDLHPTEPLYSLYCLDDINRGVHLKQTAADSEQSFIRVSEIMRGIISDVIADTSAKVQGNDAIMRSGAVLETITDSLNHGEFFFHKAKAFEAYLLGLIYAYEYVARGSFDEVKAGREWRAAIAQHPFSSTRTLADIGRRQDEIVAEYSLYPSEAVTRSFDQVVRGLQWTITQTKFIHENACRAFLGFP